MTVIAELSSDSKRLEIRVEGRFDFKMQRDFRNAYENVENELDACVVNLSEANYIDSSGLGMMMVLSEFLKEKGMTNKVEISKANDTVKELLLLSSMDRLFNIT